MLAFTQHQYMKQYMDNAVYVLFSTFFASRPLSAFTFFRQVSCLSLPPFTELYAAAAIEREACGQIKT